MGDSHPHLEKHPPVNSHKRGASLAFGGLRDFVFVDGVPISEDEYTRLYPSKKPSLHEDHHVVNHFIFPGQDVTEDVRASSSQDNEDNEFKPLSPGSIYRGPGDQRPLSTKAYEFVRKGAEGIANVSRTAAVEIAKVSRSTSMELQNLAAPVLAPIFQAIPSDEAPEHEHVQRETPKPEELERMATPYVQPSVARAKRRGRGAPTLQRKDSVILLPPPPPSQAAVPPMATSAPRVGE